MTALIYRDGDICFYARAVVRPQIEFTVCASRSKSGRPIRLSVGFAWNGGCVSDFAYGLL